MNNIFDFNKFKKKQEDKKKKVSQEMSPSVRFKIFKVMDGCMENLPILHQITQYVHHEKMLDWLVKNNLTGKEFNQWYVNECKSSILQLGAFIIARINSLEKGRPIYAYRDFKID